ncbi:MAG: hypothetical protein HOP29_08705 [Phycisphaerales bacterium]|nr:hypothetical protein [Phycisphaerales bacterium]
MQPSTETTVAPAAARRTRRNFLVSPSFQWRYVGIAVAGVFVISELMTLLLFSLLHQQAKARAFGPGVGHAWENTLVMILAAFSFAAVMGLAFGVWTVFVTHRIAGPLYVVEQHLRELGQGRFPRRRDLRRKDEFKAFYDTFWWAMESVRARHNEQLSAMAKLVELASSAHDGTDDARRRALSMIASDLDGLRWEIIRDLGITGPTALKASDTDGARRAGDAAGPAVSPRRPEAQSVLNDASGM